MSEIREQLREAMSPGWDFCYEDKYDLQDDIIEDVIAIVREALLSDEAVETVAKEGGGFTDEAWEDLPSYRRANQLRDAREVAETVFAAAFGPGKVLDTDRVVQSE